MRGSGTPQPRFPNLLGRLGFIALICCVAGTLLFSFNTLKQSFTITPKCDVFASDLFSDYSVGFENVLRVARFNHTAKGATGADIVGAIIVDGKRKTFKERYNQEGADELMDNYAACRATHKLMYEHN